MIEINTANITSVTKLFLAMRIRYMVVRKEAPVIIKG